MENDNKKTKTHPITKFLHIFQMVVTKTKTPLAPGHVANIIGNLLGAIIAQIGLDNAPELQVCLNDLRTISRINGGMDHCSLQKKKTVGCTACKKA